MCDGTGALFWAVGWIPQFLGMSLGLDGECWNSNWGLSTKVGS